jgi:transposase
MTNYLGEDNPVRAIDVLVDELDLATLGFGGVESEATGRPAYHPATLLKIYVYGYLNRVQSGFQAASLSVRKAKPDFSTSTQKNQR